MPTETKGRPTPKRPAKNAKKRAKGTFASEEEQAQYHKEEALVTLIRVYTERRDWFMVERLNNDLGRFYEGNF